LAVVLITKFLKHRWQIASGILLIVSTPASGAKIICESQIRILAQRAETVNIPRLEIILDVQLAWWRLLDGFIPENVEELAIENYAKTKLGLSRGQGWTIPTRHMPVYIDHHRAQKIIGPSLEIPGLMSRDDNGETVLIDGNHRLAQRYMLGHDTMRFFSIPWYEMPNLRISPEEISFELY
jgi:hypothetical protein